MKLYQSAVFFGTVLLAGLFLFSCSQPAQKTVGVGVMDTPAFHVQRGDEALLASEYEEARSAYRRAIKLDGENAPALSGLAVATAYAAARPGISRKTRNEVFAESLSLIEQALDAPSADDRAMRAKIHVYALQVYAALQMPEEKWADRAVDHFEEAVDLTPDDPAPYFYMARVEAIQYEYEAASRLYQKVLELGGSYAALANRELKRIQDIQRAMPGSQFGRKIAHVEKMTRADMAALFIVELNLDTIYQARNLKQEDTYRPPKSQQPFSRDPLEQYPEAVDIAGHPLAPVIQEAIDLDIKGLTPDPSHRFYPDQEIKRAELAQLLQDILIKVTRNPDLGTRFIGEPSPFPDVDADVWYYNAVRTVVSRGLMQVDNKITGEFGPFKPVSGADALLAIRSMKEILHSDQR